MKLINYTIYIVAFLFCSCSPSYTLQSYDGKVVEIKATEDSTILAIIAPYQNAIKAEMNEVLCISSVEMKKGKPESLLGNFVADLCLEQYATLADICILNNGGLRSTLPEGKITRRDIYELMPFENELVIVELNREEAQELYQYITSSGGMPFSGAVIYIDSVGVIGMTLREEKTIEEFLQNHTIVDLLGYGQYGIMGSLGCVVPEDSLRADTISLLPKKIRVITSDYLANGGDRMKFFNGKEQTKVGIKVRDAIINYCSSRDTIHSTLDNRIIYSDLKNHEFLKRSDEN